MAIKTYEKLCDADASRILGVAFEPSTDLKIANFAVGLASSQFDHLRTPAERYSALSRTAKEVLGIVDSEALVAEIDQMLANKKGQNGR